MKTRSKTKVQDMHPADIRAAVSKKLITFSELARQNGLSESACRKSLTVPSPKADVAISELLNIPLHKIWPSRYDESGQRLKPVHVREKNSVKKDQSQRLSAEAV